MQLRGLGKERGILDSLVYVVNAAGSDNHHEARVGAIARQDAADVVTTAQDVLLRGLILGLVSVLAFSSFVSMFQFSLLLFHHRLTHAPGIGHNTGGEKRTAAKATLTVAGSRSGVLHPALI